MGLDQYIFRISKPNLEERVFKSEEINSMMLTKVSVEDVEKHSTLFKQVLKYAIKQNIEVEVYNIDKLFVDEGIPADAHIWRYGSDSVTATYHNEKDERVEVEIPNSVVEKYKGTEIVPHYIWDEKEEWYWRKNYELADWIAGQIGGTENTGYYRLGKTLIGKLNRKFKTQVPEESATEESALFYWEWY